MAQSTADVKEGDLILVTGAGGFIGSCCVYQLLEKGYRVRGTVRDPKHPKNAFLKALHPRAAGSLELVGGDLMKSDGWQAALEGVDGVLHVASPFSQDGQTSEEDLVGPAVSGAENVLMAAAKAKVKRVVMTSSAYAVFEGQKVEDIPQGKVFTEADWSNPALQSGYGKSKTLAEKKAWELAEKHKIDLVTICPGLVMGRAFSKNIGNESTSNKVVCGMMLRTQDALPRTGFPAVDVFDVANGHINALTFPKNAVVGKRFIAAGEEGVMMVEVSRMLHDEFAQYGFNPTKEELSASPLNVHRCSGGQMRSVLKINFKSLRTSLKEHVLSLIALGVLPANSVPSERFAPFQPPPDV